MRFKPQPGPFKLSLGDRGEMLVWNDLMTRGYKILEKNYRCKIGEIDIVALKDGRIIFIEVKTRASLRYGAPEEAVNSAKQRKIVKVAQWYLKENKLTAKPMAFEVAAVDWREAGEPHIKIIPNAIALDYLEQEM